MITGFKAPPSFFDTVQAFLLNAPRGFEEEIHAWEEVMNEPAHCTMIVNRTSVGFSMLTPVFGQGRPFVVDVPDRV
jgi:hypothetical protein